MTQAKQHILHENLINKYLCTCEAIFFFRLGAKTGSLNSLDVKSTTAFQKQKTKRQNQRLKWPPVSISPSR